MRWIFVSAFAMSVVQVLTWPFLCAAQDGKVEPSERERHVPAFDVVLIKPSSSDSQYYVRVAPGMLVARGMTVVDLIRDAYTLRSFQVQGGPGWVSVDRYDVDAKDTSAYDVLTRDSGQVNGIKINPNSDALKAMLEQRFHLRYHIARKEQKVLALTISDSSRLKGFPCPSQPKYNLLPTHVYGEMRLNSLAADLEVAMERRVVNQTNSDECYHLDLTWDTGLHAEQSVDQSILSIPTVLRGVGLKLVPTRILVDVLTINQVQKPSPN